MLLEVDDILVCRRNEEDWLVELDTPTWSSLSIVRSTARFGLRRNGFLAYLSEAVFDGVLRGASAACPLCRRTGGLLRTSSHQATVMVARYVYPHPHVANFIYAKALAMLSPGSFFYIYENEALKTSSDEEPPRKRASYSLCKSIRLCSATLLDSTLGVGPLSLPPGTSRSPSKTRSS